MACCITCGTYLTEYYDIEKKIEQQLTTKEIANKFDISIPLCCRNHYLSCNFYRRSAGFDGREPNVAENINKNVERFNNLVLSEIKK